MPQVYLYEIDLSKPSSADLSQITLELPLSM